MSLLLSVAGLVAPATAAALGVLRPLLGWLGGLLYHCIFNKGEQHVALEAAVDDAWYDELMQYQRL